MMKITARLFVIVAGAWAIVDDSSAHVSASTVPRVPGSLPMIDPSIPPSLQPIFPILVRGDIATARRMLRTILNPAVRNNDAVERTTFAVANMLLGETFMHENNLPESIKHFEAACPELEVLSAVEPATARRSDSCFRMLHAAYRNSGNHLGAARVSAIAERATQAQSSQANRNAEGLFADKEFSLLSRFVTDYATCAGERVCENQAMLAIETWDHEHRLKSLARYTAKMLKRTEKADYQIDEEVQRVQRLARNLHVSVEKMRDFQRKGAILAHIQSEMKRKQSIAQAKPRTWPLELFWKRVDGLLGFPILYATPGKIAIVVAFICIVGSIFHAMVLVQKKQKSMAARVKRRRGQMPIKLRGYEKKVEEIKNAHAPSMARKMKEHASMPVSAVEECTVPPKRTMSQPSTKRRASRRSRRANSMRTVSPSPEPSPIEFPTAKVNVGNTKGLPKSQSEENLLKLLGTLQRSKRDRSLKLRRRRKRSSKMSPKSVTANYASSSSDENSRSASPSGSTSRIPAQLKAAKLEKSRTRRRKSSQKVLFNASEETADDSAFLAEEKSAWDRKPEILYDSSDPAKAESIPPADVVNNTGFVYSPAYVYVQAYGFDASGVPIPIPGVSVPIPVASPHPGATTMAQVAVRQIEFYFSPENLRTDTYLKSLMDAETWVDLEDIAKFRRINQLGMDPEDIYYALAAQSNVIDCKRDGKAMYVRSLV